LEQLSLEEESQIGTDQSFFKILLNLEVLEIKIATIKDNSNLRDDDERIPTWS
jgi:hypothetical protein